ncbi:benzoate/H(+) symporter BenE family transporter [Chitinilyticum piscinae]|uniref:Benzoate/H(+) symporter BenE family transporter n=1 Tax=Chitinilyticum piscinae TaxID=2866724 RepID=A0A8J7K7F6_9NEIS|nr:benzoate/H(+) symporter BenE family transporter [Chitinilyticum piscinae]MBE9607978.1 benzoate/H(+) symporter BenE family transporter [Chitinilyticum piscinae]
MLTRQDIPALTAGFITVLVGYTSSAAIVFAAARAAGANAAELASWLLALGLGMGLTCILLSLRYRVPVVTAWSTPGAALLMTSLSGVPLAQAIGAFVFSAALMLLCGVTGLFERVMNRVPMPLAAALLAGILVRFGLNVFKVLPQHLVLVLGMFAVYLLARRRQSRYAIVLVLLTGLLIAGWQGELHWQGVGLELARPVWISPAFSWPVLLGVGLPLFVVTMASQNIPGVATLHANGYRPPISPILGGIGLVNLVLAPLGCFALNLAAITAALCMTPQAHEDPQRRYLASVAAGSIYLLLGVFGATVGAVFAAFPQALVLAVAGLALFGTLAAGLAIAMRDEPLREPALITFLITASDMTLFGIGSAFWGLVGGVLAWLLLVRPK